MEKYFLLRLTKKTRSQCHEISLSFVCKIYFVGTLIIHNDLNKFTEFQARYLWPRELLDYILKLIDRRLLSEWRNVVERAIMPAITNFNIA